RINSSGNGSFAGLSGSTTLWKDFSAISFGGESQITEIASYNKGWKAGYNNQGDPVWHSTHLSCEDEGALKYFPIPYLAGSIITKARVKWQAMGNGDGVKLRIVKRDESGTSSNWTIVGTQQTYTDTGSPYDVTVSVYDFTDETMSANYSYAIEIEAEMASSGVNLFAAGIETSKRVY
ncbi:hypothetical protein JW926_04640, partial [Candidatus Sumerlaeota bacterium]|nr:hypothetical protein [Candidatus Sumerlaeota bacterium]